MGKFVVECHDPILRMSHTAWFRVWEGGVEDAAKELRAHVLMDILKGRSDVQYRMMYIPHIDKNGKVS